MNIENNVEVIMKESFKKLFIIVLVLSLVTVFSLTTMSCKKGATVEVEMERV